MKLSDGFEWNYDTLGLLENNLANLIDIECVDVSISNLSYNSYVGDYGAYLKIDRGEKTHLTRECKFFIDFGGNTPYPYDIEDGRPLPTGRIGLCGYTDEGEFYISDDQKK